MIKNSVHRVQMTAIYFMVYCSSYWAFNSDAKGFTLVAFYVVNHDATNSMKHNALSEAHISSVNQEIVHISWNPKVHYGFDNVDHFVKC